MDPSRTFSTPDVCRLAGATYRQLDYWARIGLLCPEQPARGSGSQRRYTLRQALAARAVVVIGACGRQVHRTAPLVDYLVELDDWSGAVVVTESDAVQSVDEWVTTSCREAGTILDLAAIAAHVELSMAELDVLRARVPV